MRKISELPTLDLDHGVSLDDAELAGGHAGVVARVPDVGQLQHVLADGELRVGGQVPGALPPLHSRNMGLVLELETKVHTKVCNHREGPY